MWRSCKNVVLNNSNRRAQQSFLKTQIRLLTDESAKKGGFKKLFLAFFGATAASTTGLLYYANSNPDFRRQLETSVPAAKPFLAFCLDEVFKSYVSKELPPDSTTKALDASSFQTKSTQPNKELSLAEKQLKSDLESSLPKLERLAQETIAAFEEAALTTSNFNSTLLGALKIVNPDEEDAAWQKVFVLQEERESKIKNAEKKEKDFRTLHALIGQKLAKHPKGIPTTMLEQYQDLVVNSLSSVGSAINKLQEANKNEAVVNFYNDLLTKNTQDVERELNCILPLAAIEDKLTKEHLKKVIAHALHKVELVKKKLAIYKVTEKQRILQERKEVQALYEKKMQEREEQIKTHYELAQDAEIEKRLELQRQHFETEMVSQLRRQTTAYVDHLQEMLDLQQRDLQQRYMELLDERIIDQRNVFLEEVGDSLNKVREIQEALNVRSQIDKALKNNQQIWLASQILKTSLQTGSSYNRFQDTPVNLALEIAAIENAVKDTDERILTFLSMIPREALDKGVFSQQYLKQRYNKVERLSQNVALIPTSDQPVSLLTYFLSYIRARLISVPVYTSLPELDNGVSLDPSTWTVEEILGRVRFCVQSDDLEQALRYANLLRGKPRELAKGWMSDLKLLLETQQAVEGLIAHITSIGVQASH